MNVAGLRLDTDPSNLIKIEFELRCKNTEISVLISSVVTDLVKISMSVPSISEDVLVESYPFERKNKSIIQDSCFVFMAILNEKRPCPTDLR